MRYGWFENNSLNLINVIVLLPLSVVEYIGHYMFQPFDRVPFSHQRLSSLKTMLLY